MLRPGARIIVVGAGLAGLAAGRALAQLDYQVTILEARDRLGGRCWTVDNVELGAQWIHSTEGNPVTNLARELGLSTIFVGGDSTYMGGWEQLAFVNSEDELKQHSMLAADSVRDAMDALRRRMLNDNLPDRSIRDAAQEVMRGMQLTEEQQRAVEWHLALLVRDDCAASDTDLSFLWWDDGYEVYGYGDSVFAAGYSAVIEALAAGLDIRLQHTVLEVSTAPRVRVSTSEGPFDAEAVIVTLPLGVLKSASVEFVPPLPQRKQQAIDRLGYGVLNKVIAYFDKPWWPLEQYVFACSTGLLDDSPTCVLNLWKTHHIPVLALPVGGSLAQAVEHWPDSQLREWTLRVLQQTFGASVPLPTRIERTHWLSDPFSRGSYTYVAVGSTPADFEALSEPIDDKLFFAGEATLRQHWATAQGAYVSGLREAARISGREDLLPPRSFTENRRWREMTQRANRFFNMRGRGVADEQLQERMAVLRNSSVFGSVPHAELTVLATMFDQQAFADGETICRAGERADEMYVIARGAAVVEVAGQPQASQLERGEVVGEYGMFGSGRRTATVRAVGPTVALVLDYQRFQRFLLAFPESMQALLETTVRRLLAHEAATLERVESQWEQP